MYTQDIATAISDRSLHLIIMPTEACNFRCVYCYESFKLGKMSASIIGSIKNLITSRAPTLDFLTISWFGGEPLLAIDIIESISNHIISLTQQYPSLHYKADITTNAYFITQDVFKKLLSWNIHSYQISFDGPKEFHDKKRILADGKGTFDILWENLKGMKTINENFDITVRLHVDRDNIAHTSEFLAQFKQDFQDDPRFTLYVRELSELVNPTKHKLNVFTLEEAMFAIEGVRLEAEVQNIRIRIPERKNHVCRAACYATNLNSFVIRSNGRISKCTVALDSDINDVGSINDDGTLSLDKRKMMKWGRGLESGDPTELGCPMIDIE